MSGETCELIASSCGPKVAEELEKDGYTKTELSDGKFRCVKVI